MTKPLDSAIVPDQWVEPWTGERIQLPSIARWRRSVRCRRQYAARAETAAPAARTCVDAMLKAIGNHCSAPTQRGCDLGYCGSRV